MDNVFQGYWSFSFSEKQLYASIGTSKLLGLDAAIHILSVKDLMHALSKKQLKHITELLLLSKDDGKEYNLGITVLQRDDKKIPCWLTMHCIEEKLSKQLLAYGFISSSYFCERGNKHACIKSHELLNNNFLTTVSHEFITPLNIIIGYSKLILQEEKLPGEVRSFSGHIHDSACRLFSMFSEVLDLSKLYSEQLEMKKRKFHIAEVFKAIKWKTQPVLDKNFQGRQLVFEKDLEKLLLDTDMERLVQIIDILVDNGIKFSYSGDVIVGAKMASRRMVRFYVRNYGVSIPSEIISYLFDPFTHSDESLSRKTGGLGIGLSLARELVRLMSGMIGFNQDGEILEFYVDLPYR